MDAPITVSCPENYHIISNGKDLLFFTRDHHNQNFFALFSQTTDNPMNLPLGADINTLGGLVKKKQSRLLANSPRKKNLLLIATRQPNRRAI